MRIGAFVLNDSPIFERNVFPDINCYLPKDTRLFLFSLLGLTRLRILLKVLSRLYYGIIESSYSGLFCSTFR